MFDRFRILTPDGLISSDTFLVAAPQPATVKADCVLVIHEIDGMRLTIHRTRLIAVGSAVKRVPRTSATSICLQCGKVKGVVEDQVKCLHPGKTHCDLIEISPPS
jgi:hypothetical protein